MTVIPKPDPTSRYPNEYCLTCGGGWPAYVRCDRKAWKEGYPAGVACAFQGKVPMSSVQAVKDAYERGEIPAGTLTLPRDSWAILEPPNAECGHVGADWSTLKPPK